MGTERRGEPIPPRPPSKPVQQKGKGGHRAPPSVTTRTTATNRQTCNHATQRTTEVPPIRQVHAQRPPLGCRQQCIGRECAPRTGSCNTQADMAVLVLESSDWLGVPPVHRRIRRSSKMLKQRRHPARNPAGAAWGWAKSLGKCQVAPPTHPSNNRTPNAERGTRKPHVKPARFARKEAALPPTSPKRSIAVRLRQVPHSARLLWHYARWSVDGLPTGRPCRTRQTPKITCKSDKPTTHGVGAAKHPVGQPAQERAGEACMQGRPCKERGASLHPREAAPDDPQQPQRGLNDPRGPPTIKPG